LYFISGKKTNIYVGNCCNVFPKGLVLKRILYNDVKTKSKIIIKETIFFGIRNEPCSNENLEELIQRNN
jgi:hypothetical protein